MSINFITKEKLASDTYAENLGERVLLSAIHFEIIKKYKSDEWTEKWIDGQIHIKKVQKKYEQWNLDSGYTSIYRYLM